MPHLTLPVTSDGPVVDLIVGVSAARELALKQAGKARPSPISLRCLIDTGATGTCLDSHAIAPLGLTPTGTMLITTPSTGKKPHVCETFDVGITFYHPDSSRFFGTVPIVAIDFSAQSIHGLLGRDVLANCLFVFDGAAKTFSIAF